VSPRGRMYLGGSRTWRSGAWLLAGSSSLSCLTPPVPVHGSCVMRRTARRLRQTAGSKRSNSCSAIMAHQVKPETSPDRADLETTITDLLQVNSISRFALLPSTQQSDGTSTFPAANNGLGSRSITVSARRFRCKGSQIASCISALAA
jgi:hypothetical protein